jgi:hypothetical protein
MGVASGEPCDRASGLASGLTTDLGSGLVSDTSAWARFGATLGCSTSGLSLSDVRAEMGLLRSVQAMAAARLVQLNQRLQELSRSSGPFVMVDTAREIRTYAGLRGRDARAVGNQTAAVEAAPELGRLLAAGATTAAHVESVGRVVDSVGIDRDAFADRVDEIVEKAATLRIDDFDRFVKSVVRDMQTDDGISRFEQQRRMTRLGAWTDNDGMLSVAGRVDPERGSVFLSAIDRRVEEMFHSGDGDVPLEVAPGVEPNDHRRMLALIDLLTNSGDQPCRCDGAGVTGGGSGRVVGGGGRPARAEVVVHVDLATLRTGLHAQGVCRTNWGADLPPETVRRLACEADLIPVVFDGRSKPVDVGRAKRLATVHQRRMLEAAHLTCAIDGCEVSFGRCTIHHLVPWENGGPTDLDNLVPLCSRHHHAAHEGGWRLRLDAATRRLSVTMPGGERFSGETAHGPDLDSERCEHKQLGAEQVDAWEDAQVEVDVGVEVEGRAGDDP